MKTIRKIAESKQMLLRMLLLISVIATATILGIVAPGRQTIADPSSGDYTITVVVANPTGQLLDGGVIHLFRAAQMGEPNADGHRVPQAGQSHFMTRETGVGTSTGMAIFQGLARGIYYMREYQAPTGYLPATGWSRVVVCSGHSATCAYVVADEDCNCGCYCVVDGEDPVNDESLNRSIGITFMRDTGNDTGGNDSGGNDGLHRITFRIRPEDAAHGAVFQPSFTIPTPGQGATNTVQRVSDTEIRIYRANLFEFINAAQFPWGPDTGTHPVTGTTPTGGTFELFGWFEQNSPAGEYVLEFWDAEGDTPASWHVTPTEVNGAIILYAELKPFTVPPTPTPDSLSFVKTTDRLYETPRVVQPLAGATFVLERQTETEDGNGWELVQTVTTAANGVINFDEEYLTANATYRIRETVSPTGWRRATGHWQFTTDDEGQREGIPAAHGGNPAFVNIPSNGDERLHVGNVRGLSFRHTDNQLYDTPRVIVPMAGATFVLERLVDGEWVLVQTAVSGADGWVHFNDGYLTANGTYRIRETIAPDGWELMTGYWRFTTDAYMRAGWQNPANDNWRTYVPSAHGGNPPFVNNPMAGNEGLHVGRHEPETIEPDHLVFRKTNNFLYSTPPVVQPLAGAAFALYRQNGTNWNRVGVATSDANGLVNFTEELTASANYRLVETANPDGWILPTGYWLFSTDEDGQRIAMPSEHNGNPPFVNNPQGSTGLHVGNTPEPIPGRLSFRKTNHQLYASTRVVQPFPGTATFVLERQDGTNWTNVGTATNDVNGWVSFTEDLTASATYRIRETQVSDGWLLPEGYWLFETDEDRQIVDIPAASDSDQPAFVNNPAGHTGLHVGNMPEPPTVEPGRLAFRKTTNLIYANPRVVQPLAGAAFVLYRQDGTNWTNVGTATSASNGWVNFAADLTANATYRLRETANPGGWILPEGHWTFETNADRQIIAAPTAHGQGQPEFVNNPSTSDPGLHVGNMPEPPAVDPDRLSFRKTTDELYNTPRVIQPLAGATFVLERQNGTAWVNAGTAVSASNGWVSFTNDLTASATYRLRETANPAGWILPEGHWQFSTDAEGQRIAAPVAHGGNPEFVNNPSVANPGLHVGNMLEPTPDRLSFRKTDDQLYNTPRVVMPLAGATFVLERQSGSAWVNAGTATSGSNGWVNFTNDLTASATYRIRETANPAGWILPEGHWQFTTNAEGQRTAAPTAHDGNPEFVNNPSAAHPGLHVGNMPEIVITPDRFSFRKTNDQLYNTPRVVVPLEGATFVLERQSGGTWVNAGTATSGSNGWVNFTNDLTVNATYRIRETANPAGWILPEGHWQFTTNAEGQRTAAPTAHGGNPEFVNNPLAAHPGLHVGNMPEIVITPDRFSFRKTTNTLYDTPRVIVPLAGATFVLERQNGANWDSVGTATSASNGWVTFTHDLTANATYRVRETEAPGGWLLPEGHWQFATNADRQRIATPTTHGGNPAFVNDPSAGNPGLHVGNMPAPVPQYLSFTKTNHLLYANPRSVQPLAGATFILERQAGGNWNPVQTVISSSTGLVNFTTALTANATYRLRETANPDGWILPTGHWQFTTNEHGHRTEIPVAHGTGQPVFVNNPAAGNAGLHVGNMPTADRISFIKTNHQLYANPRVVTPLSGATFVLERQTGTVWTEIGTATSATTTGLVSFTHYLTANATYRIRETVAPAGWELPTGHWQFTTNAQGQRTTVPSHYGGNPAFVNNPGTGHPGLHVGNMQAGDRRLSFRKTNHRLYETPRVVEQLPGTATFVLERQVGTSTNWTYVQTASTDTNGWVHFTVDLTASANYRLRETANPVGWVLPTGHWQFSTNEQGIRTGIPSAHGTGQPIFVNNPATGHTGLHVGNMQALDRRLSFRKTNHRLYETPRVVQPLPGITTFVLERQSGSNWTYVQTVSTDSYSWVHFTVDLTANATYRVRETANPYGWILPTGHWQFTTNADGVRTGIPSAHGNNPQFVNNPATGNNGLHVGNMPESLNTLTFRKTNHQLYSTPRIVVPLPGTATFVLERQSGANWTYIQTVSTNADGWVNFTVELTASATYRLRETANPTGWILPTGHWIINTNAQGQRTSMPTAHGNNPAFVNNPLAGHNGLHVGNMPSTPINPQTNPIMISMMIFGAVMALGLASFGIVSIAKRQTAAAEVYRTKSTRYNREKRLTDWLNDDK